MSDGIDFSHMAAEGLQERIQQVARDLEAKNNLGSVFIMVTYKDQDNKTRLVNAKTVQILLHEIRVAIDQRHGVATRHERDGRGLIHRRLKLVERKGGNHLTGIRQVRRLPG